MAAWATFLNPPPKFCDALTVDAACGKGPPQLLSLLPDMSQVPHQLHARTLEGQGLPRCCSTLSAPLCCLIFLAFQGRRHGNAWKIHRTIQLVFSQIMIWDYARSSGTGGRQMPETFPRPWKRSAIASTFSVWQRAL